MDRVMRMLKTKYATFDGRARRKEYWLFVLFNVIASVIALAIDSVLFGVEGLPLLQLLVTLALVVPGLAVGFRRLHDVDKSAWWMLIVLIPIAGALILLWWSVRPGTKGPNRFGDDPIAEEEAASGLPAVEL